MSKSETNVTDTDEQGSLSSEYDLVIGDIERELAQLRASGRLTPDFEKELSQAFARLVPEGNPDEELFKALQEAEEASMIDLNAPMAATSQGAIYAKRIIHKATAWYMNHMGNQIQEMGRANSRVLRLVASRIEELEARTDAGIPVPVLADSISRTRIDLAPWISLGVAKMSVANGRMAHLGSGDGSLLSAIVAEGRNAYGVENDEVLSAKCTGLGLDVWTEQPEQHLERVAVGSLCGLIMSDFLDWTPPSKLWKVLNSASGKLIPGAPIVLIVTSPFAWRARVGNVRADLLAGHPLYPETWEFLMNQAGFENVEVHRGASSESLEESVDAGEIMNANIRLINEFFFGADSFAITGNRSS